MRSLLTTCFLLFTCVLQAQLLSWTPEFFGDGGSITITVNANFGNQGLKDYNAEDVYIHTGVITNLSATPNSWRYVNSQNFNAPNAAFKAVPVPGQPNKWTFSIANIRAYYGVPAEEQILKISLLFRSGNGTRVQRNSDGSDMYIPVTADPAALDVRITNPFSEPRFVPVVAGICKNVGESVVIEAKSSITANLRILLNGNEINSTNGTSISANPTIAAAGLQRVIVEASVPGAGPVFTFNGNGAWINPSNWQGGVVPPATIPSGTEVVIQPSPGGACLLDVSSTQVTFAAGSKLSVGNGALFNINGNFSWPAESAFSGGQLIVRDTIDFFVSATTALEALPVGVNNNGITYHNGGTAATLVLYAPNKNNIVVVGDFNNWNPTLSYQMKRTPDNLRYWLRIEGLTPGQEYAYQYKIDCNLTVADYNSEKILDPWNDGEIIAENRYPNLKPYPVGKGSGIVSVLQPAKPQYTWQNNSFQRPDKRNLMVYEILIRDFVTRNTFQSIIDTLPYLANLGINALEFMPFFEFEGNKSWGYNPSFMFAVDKYYGTEQKLKELIDSCHGRGIAVILDMVLNHQFGQSPMVQMYWDAANNRPAANSPWFNTVPKHGFNVGYDMNHEAPATIEFVERVMQRWMVDFKIDGFRWDLSKGFTQVQTCDNNGGFCNVEGWSAYDQSRVNIWDRIYNQSQAISPGSYQILEHLGVDKEEAELAKKGMLLWGKMTNEFNEASMGYNSESKSNFERAYHTTRWSNDGGNDVPLLLSYAESHDEERLMQKNQRFGNTGPGHDTKILSVKARRMQAVHAFLFTIPGPKMLWQFGELAYDSSINMCADLTNSENCRVDNKPPAWRMPPNGSVNYFANTFRKGLYDMTAKLLRLRTKNPQYINTFSTNLVDISLSGDFKRQIILSKLPASDPNHLDIVVIGNFGVEARTGSVNMPSEGTWHIYAHNIEGFVSFSGINANLNQGAQTLTVPNGGNFQSFNLPPGSFLVLLNKQVNN